MQHSITQSILLLCLLLVVCESRKQRFNILHTSDLHSHFEGIGPDSNLADARGHFARLKYAITKLQERLNPYATLTLDAGDWNSGTFFHLLQVSYQYPQLTPEFSFLQDCNYDATVLGNHEFDGSEHALSLMIDKAERNGVQMPILCANIVLDEDCELHKHYLEDCKADYELPRAVSRFYNQSVTVNGCPARPGVVLTPYILKELKESADQESGLKVAIIGLFSINAEQLSANWRTCSQFKGTLHGANFGEFIQTVKERILEIRSRHNPDLIVLLNHSGEQEDEHIVGTLLNKIDEHAVHVHISSHSHHIYLRRVGGAFIHQVGAYATNLGVLQFSYDFDTRQLTLLNENETARHTEFEYVNHSTLLPLRIPMTSAIPYDSDLMKQIESYKREINRSFLKEFKYDTPIGVIYPEKTDIDLVAKVADMMLEEVNLELAHKAQTAGHNNVERAIDILMLSTHGVRMHVADLSVNGTKLQFSDVFRTLGVGVLNPNFTSDVMPGNRVAHFYLPVSKVKQLIIQIDFAGTFINDAMHATYATTLDYTYKTWGIPLYNLPYFKLHGQSLNSYERMIHIAMPEFIALFLKLTDKFSKGLLTFNYYDRHGRVMRLPFFSDDKDYMYLARALQKRSN